jgi:ABC-2 type transport system ATP-binding protein
MTTIDFKNVCVDFPVTSMRGASIRNVVLNKARQIGGHMVDTTARTTVVRALENVSFKLGEGDRLGLVGHNGSGKTTLLRVIAGALAPSVGQMDVNGKCMSMFDIGIGIDAEATGYENIYLRSLIMGLTPAEIEQKTAEIAEFSELGGYLDLPVRTYSSGMAMRLMFAIATSIDGQIVLMDEWISVGDQNFKEKANTRLRHLTEKAGILVIASHEAGLLKNMCNLGLLLEAGQVKAFGPIEEVLNMSRGDQVVFSAPHLPKASLPEAAARATAGAPYEFDRHVDAGKAAEAAGKQTAAVAHYVESMRLMYRYGPAQVQIGPIAAQLCQSGVEHRDAGEHEKAIKDFVRSIELNPDAAEPRQHLAALLARQTGRDLTKECLIFPDPARATQFYRHAIQTCVDFVVFGGVIGDIFEFGVLGGWTARNFAEISRDMAFYGDLKLFDSFEGLPLQKHALDRTSYDVQRGIWREEMHLPEAWEADFGEPLKDHIVRKLSQIISLERIIVRQGFYSETLQTPLTGKAAIVHMDCDLYQSTVEVFMALERDDILQDGTIIMFDDWNCNRANPAYGQRLAFHEFLERNKGGWSTSHFMNYGFNCAAFILHRVEQGRALPHSTT